ncbi:MAG: hypothetical protein MH204_03075, partial [Fimbriimonadaceae bacterium]|nr:hypothetical protein [Fimbriimonadaceae bacterium]
QGDPADQVGGAFVNPDTGKIDPTLRAPKGDPRLPVAAGNTLVRWWVGLRDPERAYSNPSIQLRSGGNLVALSNGGENLFVLWRAEVPIRVWDRVAGRFVANAAFFAVDALGNPILDDPDFFTQAGDATRRANWARVGRIETESAGLDLIAFSFNKQNREAVVNGLTPEVTSLVRFQPKRNTGEALVQMSPVPPGLETDNAAKVGADTFAAGEGAWTVKSLRIQPAAVPGAFGPGNASAGSPFPASDGTIAYTLFDLAGDQVQGLDPTRPMFNLSRYLRLASGELVNGSYPFTGALEASALTLPEAGAFVPVVPDLKSGVLRASFDIREVGSDLSVPVGDRLPTSAPNAAPGSWGGIHTGPAVPAATDTASGDWATFDWDDWQNANVGINRRFNKLWANLPTLAPGVSDARERFAKRFIYLPALIQPGGVASPLATNAGLLRGAITPGSESVIGPNQLPGPSFGQPIRYSRTTNRPVGPNEYYINYTHQIEPDWASLGLAVDLDPLVHNESDLAYAVFRAQYRAGYVEFNSKPGEPLPAGNIRISYRFQFTEPNDVVTVDYDSSRMIDILVGLQTLPSQGIPNPQLITVRGSATVRNFLR